MKKELWIATSCAALVATLGAPAAAVPQ